LVIGVSEYEKLEPLNFCKNDGRDMVDALHGLGYDIPKNNSLMGYVRWDDMRDAIYDFFTEETKPQDTLLMYFSGHGVPDVDGDIYLATSETEPFRLQFASARFYLIMIINEVVNSFLHCFLLLPLYCTPVTHLISAASSVTGEIEPCETYPPH
jgi:hypothetical protein